jgi:hypothetical protein
MRFVDPDGMRNLDVLKDIIVTSKNGTVLFTLDDGKKAKTKMTVEQLYNKGTQWFEPLANNYMPLKSISKGLYSNSAKHFTSKQILDFANVDRSMISYSTGLSGDWKKQKEGGDGYYLVTVDGKPYWGDAIGQIPFATNKAKDEIKNGETVYDANVTTIKAGQKYADGSLFGGTPDTSKSYDNFMILRGAMYGSQGRDITRPITQEEATMYGY